jgi:ERCC4-type nuclease
LNKQHLSNEIKTNLSLLIDTREKKIDHIKTFLDSNNIQYELKKLNVGDYSFTFNGIEYSEEIIIERKANIDEIVGNFTENRDRFEREFLRMPQGKKYLLVENSTWDKIYKHCYKSQLPPKTLAASLYTFQHRFNINILFSSREYTPHIIYGVFFYYIREKIIRNEVIL